MYTQENYLWGVVAYLLGVLLVLPFTWRLSRLITPWSIPLTILRLLILALLLTPVKAYNDMVFLAPAWVVAGFEMVRPTTVEGAARGIAPIAVCFMLLIAAYLAWLALKKVLTKDDPPANSPRPDRQPTA